MRIVGIILAVAGVVVVGGYAIYHFFRGFFTASQIPLYLRIGVPVIVAGVLLLLISVGWERYKASRKETFKE